METNQNPFEQYSEEDRASIIMLLLLMTAMSGDNEFQGDEECPINPTEA